MRKGENKRAIELLQFSLKHETTKDKERLEVLQYLCELHFEEKAFDVCLGTGRKLKETYKREKNEVITLSYGGFSQDCTIGVRVKPCPPDLKGGNQHRF